MTRPKARWGEAMAWAQAAAHYTGDDCLLWPFGKTNGYGAMEVPGRGKMHAHRYICELVRGAPFSIWNQAAHRCGNRQCCNPKHVRWTTRAENENDKKRHGRNNGGERHGMSKLTASDVLRIRRERAAGVPREQLARELNISPSTVYYVASGRRWGSVTGENA